MTNADTNIDPLLEKGLSILEALEAAEREGDGPRIRELRGAWDRVWGEALAAALPGPVGEA